MAAFTRPGNVALVTQMAKAVSTKSPQEFLTTDELGVSFGAPPRMLKEIEDAVGDVATLKWMLGSIPRWKDTTDPADAVPSDRSLLQDAFTTMSTTVINIVLRNVLATAELLLGNVVPLTKNNTINKFTNGFTVYADAMTPTVADEGPLRTLTANSITRTTSWTEIGIAAKINTNALRMERGVMEWAAKMQQIANATTERFWNEIMVMLATFDSSEFEAPFLQVREEIHMGIEAQMVANAANCFFAQKNRRSGFKVLLDELSRRWTNLGNNTAPDTLIIPSGIKRQFAFNILENTYALSGKPYNKQFNPDAWEYENLGGYKVLESREARTGNAQTAINPFESNIAIGDSWSTHFKIASRMMRHRGGVFNTEDLDCDVFDASIDNLVPFLHATAMRSMNLFKRGGSQGGGNRRGHDRSDVLDDDDDEDDLMNGHGAPAGAKNDAKLPPARFDEARWSNFLMNGLNKDDYVGKRASNWLECYERNGESFCAMAIDQIYEKYKKDESFRDRFNGLYQSPPVTDGAAPLRPRREDHTHISSASMRKTGIALDRTMLKPIDPIDIELDKALRVCFDEHNVEIETGVDKTKIIIGVPSKGVSPFRLVLGSVLKQVPNDVFVLLLTRYTMLVFYDDHSKLAEHQKEVVACVKSLPAALKVSADEIMRNFQKTIELSRWWMPNSERSGSHEHRTQELLDKLTSEGDLHFLNFQNVGGWLDAAIRSATVGFWNPSASDADFQRPLHDIIATVLGNGESATDLAATAREKSKHTRLITAAALRRASVILRVLEMQPKKLESAREMIAEVLVIASSRSEWFENGESAAKRVKHTKVEADDYNARFLCVVEAVTLALAAPELYEDVYHADASHLTAEDMFENACVHVDAGCMFPYVEVDGAESGALYSDRSPWPTARLARFLSDSLHVSMSDVSWTSRQDVRHAKSEADIRKEIREKLRNNFHEDFFNTALDCNIILPFGYRAMRPHIVLLVGMIAALRSGGETARLFYSFPGFWKDDDGQRQTSLLSFRVFIAAVMMNPLALVRLRNAFLLRYKCGGGVKIFPNDDKNKGAKAPDNTGLSVYLAPTWMNEYTRSTVFSTTGAYPSSLNPTEVENAEVWYSSMKDMDILHNFSDGSTSQNVPHVERLATGRIDLAQNTICMQSFQSFGGGVVTIANLSHFGPIEQPCRGVLASFTTPSAAPASSRSIFGV
jgi:hypothetical protein